MIKHIVLWRLLPEAEGAPAQENARRVKAALEDLIDDIPEIVTFEVGLTSEPSESAWDVSLYSTFESWEDLETYIAHPAHKRVAEFIGRVRADRAAVDYEA